MRSRSLQLARLTGVVLLALIVWISAFAIFVAFEDDKIAVTGNDSKALLDAAKGQTADFPGNLAMVIIENGRVGGQHFKSIGRPIDADTLFQMASVSKWITAWGVMTLVESGEIELDAPVSRYLRRWRLPPSDYDRNLVTVRRLLAHTAGLTDDLGYCGFAPGQHLQPLPASLTAAADACPFTNGRVEVGARPGRWRYSGGGYSVLQLMIEDVSGQPFADYMDAKVLKPLGMNRSTFRPRAPGATNVAAFFDSDGSVAQHFAYTAAGAASLYSSIADLTLFVNVYRPGSDGEVIGRGVLSPGSVAELQSPQARVANRPHWGLGVRLYAPTRDGGYIFGHDGGNRPAVNTAIRFDPLTGDAIIALSTGGDGIATRLASAWVRQRANPADMPSDGINPFVVLARLWSSRQWLAVGAIIICLAGAFSAFRIVQNPDLQTRKDASGLQI